MFSDFFIERPRFAFVVSIILSFCGALCLSKLPVEEYPEIAPPTVRVQATYPGASAQVIAETVAKPLEDQINGVDNLVYYSSTCNNNGSYNCSVTFSSDSDSDMDMVNLQNAVKQAEKKLPGEVTAKTVSVRKRNPDMVAMYCFTTDGTEMSKQELADYVDENIKESVMRLEGVSVAELWSAQPYAMRIWLDPVRMAGLGITISDISYAIESQNVQAAAGTVGAEYANSHLTFKINVKGRLKTKDEFENIVVRTNPDTGAQVLVKDVARVYDLPIPESNRLTKMIPDRPILVRENGMEVEKKPTLANCIKYIPEMKSEYETREDLVKEVLKYALQLEGCVRQVSIHACAMIIGRGNLTDYIPITMGEDKATGQKVWVSQYEGSQIEDVGMLKMDFLGLKTLSIISRCLELIRKRNPKALGPDFDIEKIPIDDPAVFDLYSRGDTKSVFQFESGGMREWLMRLRPERFEDLIAMNALYRPGPMDYIPQFVARKTGAEAISYDLPEMGDYLKETYGVTVYQEQVMQISQAVAGFSKGKADKLRKAMGKKKKDILDGLKKDFMEGATANGHPAATLEKIWSDWEAFAKYAFNKSHATCYAWVSYQTAWLKAHYPSEFQASNLTQQSSNMDEMKEIMADCKKGGIKVLNPDINESDKDFSVNKGGDVRFGLGGLKGFGENVVNAIIDERALNGNFADVWDFMERMSLYGRKMDKPVNVNRKSLETLVNSGAFDSFGYKRAQFYAPCKSGELFIDELIKYAALYADDQADSMSSLFGGNEDYRPDRPEMPQFIGEEDVLDLLQKEKEVVGMYLSAHPLDRYAFEIENFTTCKLADLPARIDEQEHLHKSSDEAIAGIITEVKQITTRTGLPGARVVLEDYSGTYELALFGKDYEAYMPYMKLHEQLFIEGEIVERYRLKPEEAAKGKKAPYSFKIRKISLLGNVGTDHIKALALNLDSKQLSEKFRKSLVKALREYGGNTRLKVFLYDAQSGYRVELYSKKFEVAVCADFIAALEHLGISYSVDKS